MYTEKDHTWVICAYKESPYLEECIRSLMNQTVKSSLVMVTSTPGPFLEEMAAKYGLPLKINEGEKGIGGDWNFGLSAAETPLITLAHQDDIYEPAYTEEMLAKINRAGRPILYFSDYGELRNGEKADRSKLLKIKRMMLTPMRLFPGWSFARRLSLSCGNPICCPAITYIREIIKDYPFKTHFKSNLDWEQTERLSRLKGRFVYNPRILMYHRIHEDSTTSEIIGDNGRTAEDEEMMAHFWPRPIARRIARRYASGEKCNQV